MSKRTEERFFNRLQELSGVDANQSRKPNLEEEDELNYSVYEMLAEAEMECTNLKRAYGYYGTISIALEESLIPKEYSKEEIAESLKFEKELYKSYIKENIDLTHLTSGDSIHLNEAEVVEENGRIIFKIGYDSKPLDGEELFS